MANGARPGPLAIPQLFGPNGQIIDIEGVAARYTARPRHLRAFCKVYMNGQDLTSRLDPVLLSVRVTDKKMGASVAQLTIDDSYGRIPNPPDGAACEIALGWGEGEMPKVFFGYLSNVYSSMQRQSGRLLDVEFTSYLQTGNGKTTLNQNWGKGKDDPDGEKMIDFKQVAEELAKQAGITNFKIAPSMAAKQRSYWGVRGQTPLGALEAFAKELGGSFKMDGINAGIADPLSGQAADGSPLTARACVVGENVLAWRIVPSVARAQWGSLHHGFFDRDKAARINVESLMEGGFGFFGAKAKRMGPWPSNNEEMAKTSAKADNVAAVEKRGTGWVVVDGMPEAQAGGQSSLHGFRPGVDGLYNNEEVEHSYYRGGGYVTRIDVERPELYVNATPSGNFTHAPPDQK